MTNWRDWVGARIWVAATIAAAVAVFLISFAIASAVHGGDAPSSTPVARATGTAAAAAPERLLEPGTATSETAAIAADPDGPRATLSSLAAALPDFDEEDLVHGGEGRQGAILGGPGIVNSSALDSRTPWTLLVPSARIRARIVALGLTPNDALGAPDNPEVIGWWRDGAAPGEIGNVLLDGHRDFRDTAGNVGTGVCWLLPDTRRGDFVLIRDEEAAVTYLYMVSETVSVAWDAPESVRYLQPTSRPILTLITCEGSFDTDARNYSNRHIVVADLTDVIPYVPETR